MVDVGGKADSRREATAAATVLVPETLLRELVEGSGAGREELMGAKGPVFSTATVAGIQAAKRTSELIPLCHPLPVTHVGVSLRVADSMDRVLVECKARVSGKTGVEMEALTGASVAALTVYDMLKARAPGMEIEGVRLVRKTGGKSDYGVDGERSMGVGDGEGATV